MRNVIIVTVLAILFLAGYRDSYGQQSVSSPSTTIEVSFGEDAVITLDANHTTGFCWQLAKPLQGDILELKETKYTTSDTHLLGAGGEEIWFFKTLKRGRTEVSLRYVRPWEKDAPPAREANFVIIVK